MIIAISTALLIYIKLKQRNIIIYNMANIETSNWDDKQLYGKILADLPRCWRQLFMEPYINGERNMINKEFILAMNQLEPIIAMGGEFIYPLPYFMLAPFKLTPLNEVKVVLLGQDPYPNKAAQGLAFSSPKVEKSLAAIFDVLVSRGFIGAHPATGDLTSWAEQGVLLSNMALVVGGGAKHHKYWHKFTNEIMRYLHNHTDALFILFGGNAIKDTKEVITDPARRFEWGHPSPLNRDNRPNNPKRFANCDVFNRVNDALGEERAIKWGSVNPSVGPIQEKALDKDIVYAFTDGATSANGKPGSRTGWAYKIMCPNRPEVDYGDSGEVLSGSSNNRGELTAIHMALIKLSELYDEGVITKDTKVLLVGDNLICLQCVFVWARGWIDYDALHDKKNTDIIIPAFELYDAAKYKLDYEHVYSHQPQPPQHAERRLYIWNGNDIVDRAASAIIR
jgi:uracil-DNA glycosylase